MADIDVEDIVAKLSLSEKVDLLSGIDVWHTKPLPQYGIPSLRLSDGPNGVRGPKNFNAVPAACFPCGTALGAIWDLALLHEAGMLMSEEAKAKGAHVILGPCINMQRGPLGGRGFESLSEDPVLAGLGAAALIKGMESDGIVATIKHFVCNDQEDGRIAFDAIVTERALREIYLLPFQIAVKEANPGGFMTSYNKLNGVHVSEGRLMEDTLRGEWGWEGIVMSDWLGTYSVSESVNAGLDLEMPGPTRWRGKALVQAVTANKVAELTMDERVRNVLRLVKRCARSGVKENQKEVRRDTPETAALLRKVAADSIVLMRNDRDVLPLRTDKPVLMIGSHAKVATYCGGGSSFITPYYAVTPFDGVREKLADPDLLSYSIGAQSHKFLPLLAGSVTSSGKPGMSFKSYNAPPSDPNRVPADILHTSNTHMLLLDYKCPRLDSALWYADIEGTYTTDEAGTYEFGLCVYGTAKLYVDGKLVVDNETRQRQGSVFFGCGTLEETGTVELGKGQRCELKVQFGSAPTAKLGRGGVVRFEGGGVRIGCTRVIDPKEEIRKAAEMAKDFEQVVLCAGLNGDFEAEGADRPDMDLPPTSTELITAVLAANPRTTVVLQSGTPVTMPWLSQCSTLLHAWYGGNETGNAMADVLFGDVNPSARLPLSFPLDIRHNPTYLNYRMEGGRTLYGEDVYVGYRYYETVGREVGFMFGHGLSYTQFEFRHLKVQVFSQGKTSDNVDQNLAVSADVVNIGPVPGKDVVQVYVSQRNPSIRRPVRELKGFQKTKRVLGPGETENVEVVMDIKYACSFWDENRGMWKMERDTYDVLVTDGAGVEVRRIFEVEGTRWWRGL